MNYPTNISTKEREFLEELGKRFPNINQTDIDRYAFMLQDIRLEAKAQGLSEGQLKGEAHGAREEKLKWLGWRNGPCKECNNTGTVDENICPECMGDSNERLKF